MTFYADTDPVVISSGNDKIGKIPNVSLPPIISCVPGVPCGSEKTCYSLKAWAQYPNVRAARLHNWKLWLTQPKRYFSDLRKFLSKKNPPYFRFHTDGDIPNIDYFNRMVRLAQEFPRTRFLCFTKRYNMPFHECPFNLTVIPSAWPGMELPQFKRIAWMEDGRELRYRHARFDCNKGCDECFACWHIQDIGMDVVFKKH